jgi:hypothetical protein
MVITSGWAFAVMAGVFTAIACGSSDAHLNPAVTMGFAISSAHFGKFAPFLLAQMAGAFVGAVLVWVHFLPHGKETPDQTLKLACFLHGAGDPAFWRKPDKRDCWNACPRVGRRSNLFESSRGFRPGLGIGPVLGRRAGLGDRAVKLPRMSLTQPTLLEMDEKRGGIGVSGGRDAIRPAVSVYKQDSRSTHFSVRREVCSRHSSM